MEYALLILGFVLLLFGGRYLVKASVALAERYHVSSMVIGLTVVSFGTSAPELFVSLVANIKDHPEVALGNVIGSNIVNIVLVLSLTAVFLPIPIQRSSVKYDAPFMLLVSILFWLFMSNLILSRVEGTIFLLLIIAYIYMLFRFSSKKDLQTVVSKYETKMSLGKIIIILILADAGLAIGSDLLVDNASIIAGNLGVDERTIAITIIAFGTSLPELSTSLIAALHQETDISIGNIIGSNIFNILGIIGITSVVRPLKVNPEFIRNDIFWMLGTSALLYLFILPFGGSKLGRYKAAILLIVYCVYLYILYFRAT